MNGFGKGAGALVFLALFSAVLARARGPQSGDPLAARLEMARRTRNETQLQSLKTELEERTRQNQGDVQNEYELAKVQGYLADVYLLRKDKKAAAKAIDSAIE